MLEVLQIIVLACQISSGRYTVTPVHEYQVKCQKELIECVRSKSSTPIYALEICLRERKETL